MRILSVDDSATARLTVKLTLEGEGHQVLEAPDGAVALSILEAHPGIEVVVLDWNMPVMNGIDCLRAIRRNRDLRELKVLMCATEAERTLIMAAIKAGANGYVLKPVSAGPLVAAVRQMMGASGVGADAATGGLERR